LLPRLLGRFRAIKQALALGVEITQMIGLEPVSQNAKQQVAGQVRGRPGTITGVITLAVAHAKLALPVTALVAVVVAAGVMWIMMVFVARGGTRASGGLMHDTATRFMGLIVLAMGVQFALTGFHDFSTAHP
jgi:hypothetical protein